MRNSFLLKFFTLILFSFCITLASCDILTGGNNNNSGGTGGNSGNNGSGDDNSGNTYDTSVYKVYEAEDAALSSITTGIDSENSITYAYMQNVENSCISFKITTTAETKAYLKIHSKGAGGDKTNYMYLNGTNKGSFISTSDWAWSWNDYITLNAGENTISFPFESGCWGWYYLDSIELVNPANVVTPGFTNYVTTPCNSNANSAAKKLMADIAANYGKKIITGQMDLTWEDSIDMAARVYSDTGKYPKLMGYDFMNYLDYTSRGGLNQTDEAIAWWNAGGYVAFCWHWRMKGSNGNNSFSVYNSSSATDGTDFEIPYDTSTDSWNKTVDSDSDGTSDYDQIIADFDVITAQLATLQTNGVPVLWRPLHEGAGNVYNGGDAWFWWGNSGSTQAEKAESYIALWKLMYDYFTNTKGLNNLLWVWNGQAADYYPGDDYVDFIGLDIYETPKDYSSKYSNFVKAVNYCDNPSTAPKMVALTENGTIPSPSLCKEDGSMWAWFMTWNDGSAGEHVDASDNYWSGEYYNEDSHKKEVYESSLVITR